MTPLGMTRSGKLTSREGIELAWQAEAAQAGEDGRCGVFWLGGFMSDMEGSKAQALAALARETGRPCLRFDYSGHGASGGVFREATISRWLGEAVSVFSELASGPHVVVGSSMGGWLALLLARHLAQHAPETARHLAGMVLIAPAADMTEDLMWAGYDTDARARIMDEGFLEEPSQYGDMPYVITRALIEDGRKHLILAEGLSVDVPVVVLQGEDDPDVPWEHGLKTYRALRGDDITFNLIKHGDHRLSTARDLARLRQVCCELCELADARIRPVNS